MGLFIKGVSIMKTKTKKYLSCAETAKLLRKALTAKFPKIKFSVRSKTYSGGASINVGWTNGPTSSQVKKICDLYEGADFDGMQDLKTYKSSILVGVDGNMEKVHFGADFIFESRHYTPEYDWLLCTNIDLRGGKPSLKEQLMCFWERDRRAYGQCQSSLGEKDGRVDIKCDRPMQYLNRIKTCLELQGYKVTIPEDQTQIEAK